MTRTEFVLACGPPALAVALQVFQIPNDRWIDGQGAAEQRRNGLPVIAATIIRETAKGCVAMRGLAPTVVSYVTGTYALFASEPPDADQSIYICMAVVLVGLLATIASVALVLGRSAMGIATGGLRTAVIGFGPTPATVIDLIVYGLNGLLIVLAIAIYWKFLRL